METEERFLLWVFLICSAHHVYSQTLHGSTDAAVLLSFKANHITSDPNHTLSGWNTTAPLCTWYGVSCTANRTRVRNLILQALGLSGTISPHLSNLSYLESLSLARNNFSGRIPAEFGRLSSLLHLKLSENQLTGEIPLSIYNISTLRFLSVTSNNLTGKLPQNMGRTLPNLEEVYMSLNNFYGPIPISLSSNASKIRFLHLSSNNFDGYIPSQLGQLRDLREINLADNQLSSTTNLNMQFFTSLTNCTLLEKIGLATNSMEGEIPSSMANLSIHLTEFCIDMNYLSGNIPQWSANFPNLTVLALHQNQFTGTVPSTVGILPNLQRLSLHQNRLSGEIPSSLGNLTRLYEIYLGGNRFIGNVPKSIGNCRGLTELGLAENKLTGSIPTEIFDLTGLTLCRLARNSLSGPLPREVGNLKMLEEFDISDNRLAGQVPVSLGYCLSLITLGMAKNDFEGSIPQSFEGLRALENLDLSSNSISGEIPEFLQELKFLKNLNLSFNDLHGRVPSKGVFTNSSYVSLQGNKGLCVERNTSRLGLSKCVVSPASKKGRNRVLLPFKIIIPIISLALIVFCLIFIILWRKRRCNRRGFSTAPSLNGRHRKVSYTQLFSATNGFDSVNLIGHGSFGSVYKGVLSGKSQETEAIVVAIKVFNQTQSKASKSFETECKALRNIRHRNLVKIITSCSSIDHSGNDFKALIMHFMSNGSLDRWLDSRNGRNNLNLLRRVEIAIDVAAAMDYLHRDSDPPVVHCDLKPSNVLLDEEMTAHVADFGLARLMPQSSSQNQSSTLGLKGSIGYMAPEYGLGGQISTSGDVYSYGILLLEMFTGKKPTEDIFKDGLNLYKFASAVNFHQVLEIIDPRLEENDNNSSGNIGSTSRNTSSSLISSMGSSWKSKREECFASVMRIGLSCAAESAKERPSMRETLTKMNMIRKRLLGSDDINCITS